MTKIITVNGIFKVFVKYTDNLQKVQCKYLHNSSAIGGK